jgi:Fur family zinc uptake transcriptional regulator
MGTTRRRGPNGEDTQAARNGGASISRAGARQGRQAASRSIATPARDRLYLQAMMDAATPARQTEIEDRLDAVATACARDGIRFTELRREILALILAADRPVGAYDLLDRLRQTRKGAVPPTVYRGLDFLLARGLIHRVERLNAFVSCPDEHGHAHPVQFLICRDCGAVDELEETAIADAVTEAAERKGFRPALTTIEVEGVCARCAATP